MKTYHVFLVACLILFTLSCQSKLSDAEIYGKMSTEKLVQDFLAHPNWEIIFAFNSPRDGLSVFIERSCPELGKELFRRDDFAAVLLDEYSKLDPLAVDQDWTDIQKGQFKFEIYKIELLFTEGVIINQLSNVELRKLKETVISNYHMKKILQKIYNDNDLSSSAAVCMKIIEKVNSDLLIDIPSELYTLRYYLFIDIRYVYLLDVIIELLESIEV